MGKNAIFMNFLHFKHLEEGFGIYARGKLILFEGRRELIIIRDLLRYFGIFMDFRFFS
jgi:hypothetical protein